jgi:phospholipid/cholesterol/gamma-HCH transport system substrate-binding protein
MDERVLSFRVGIVVVTAATLTVLLVILFGAGPRLKPTYQVRVKFPRAPGVAVDTPVRKSGVTIGRVADVELLSEGGVVLTIRLDQDKPVRLNEYPRISMGSLVTGDAVVEFVRNETDPRTDLLKNGDFLPNGQVVHDPFEVMLNLEEKMSGAFTSIETAATRAAVILENLQWLGSDKPRFDAMLTKTERALDSFHQAMSSIDEVLGDEQLRQQLRSALADLPQVFDEAKLTLEETRKTMAGFDAVTRRAEANLANLEKFTAPLAERSERIIASVEGSAANLDELLQQLVHLVDGINQRQGTLGKLVFEDDVYYKLNSAVGNIEELTRKLQPVLNDVRVFTDKIARDPSQLGVGGALNRRPTGLKGSVLLE